MKQTPLESLKQILIENGYFNLKEIPNRGLCALNRFAFTTGLCYNITENEYEGRFCYNTMAEATKAIESWSGIGSPTDSDWIKHKGRKAEYPNPNKE